MARAKRTSVADTATVVATASLSESTDAVLKTATTDVVGVATTATLAKTETATLTATETETTETTTKTMADFARMDYASRGRLFGGLDADAFEEVEEEGVKKRNVILPTDGAVNFDKFYTIDTGFTLMFYEGKWYMQ